MPLRSFAVVSAVEHDSDVAPVGGHFVGIPLAPRLRHRIDLDVAGDRTSAITGVRALVEDIGLVARPVGDLLRIKATEIDAAIGIVAWPELDAYDEVLVRILAHQIAGILARHLVDHNSAVLDAPVELADLIPSIEAFSVEQRDPACFLADGFRCEVAGGKAQSGEGENKTNCAPRCGTHGVSSFYSRLNLSVGSAARMDEIVPSLSTWGSCPLFPGALSV